MLASNGIKEILQVENVDSNKWEDIQQCGRPLLASFK